jgi:cytochrome bd-type quinol oxidase subunit 2
MSVMGVTVVLINAAHGAALVAVKAASLFQSGVRASHQALAAAYATAGPRALALGSLPPGTQSDINTVQSWMLGLGATVAVGSLIAVGIMMMGDHGQASGHRHGSKLIKVFAGMALVGSASAIGSALLP